MSRASAYRATYVKAERIGVDGRGNRKYRITYRTEADNATRTANTRGHVDHDLADVWPGDRVNLIRDGRGSVVVIEVNPR